MSWWGLPGTGVGGMQARGTGLEVVRVGYHYADDLKSLADVPVLTSATKSLSARWTAPADALVVANLTDLDGFATGTISNRTGRPLRNARLLYNGWGYWLGNLEDEQQVEVGEQLDLRRVKTIVTSSALGRSAAGTGEQQRTMFSPERATATELVNLMMLYEAAGSADFAQLPNQIHSELDLSGVLRPGMRRAVLIAEAEGPGSELIHSASGEPLGDKNDYSALILRFILPITENGNAP
jgi:hypothetical protein